MSPDLPEGAVETYATATRRVVMSPAEFADTFLRPPNKAERDHVRALLLKASETDHGDRT